MAHQKCHFKMYFIIETQSSKNHIETESIKHNSMRHIKNICALSLTLS